MDDLISRQAAIDMLKNRWKKTRIYEGIGDDIAEECELYLKQVPSAQKWIPCSEMLPMDKGVYLVTDDSGRVAWVEKSWFMWCDDGSPFWEYANVTAWMPLPSPYREEATDG